MFKKLITIMAITVSLLLVTGCAKKNISSEIAKCIKDGVTLEMNGNIEKAVEKYAEGYRLYDSIPQKERKFSDWEYGTYLQYLLQIITPEEFAKNIMNCQKTKVLANKSLSDIEKLELTEILTEEAFLPKSRADVLKVLTQN